MKFIPHIICFFFAVHIIMSLAVHEINIIHGFEMLALMAWLYISTETRDKAIDDTINKVD